MSPVWFVLLPYWVYIPPGGCLKLKDVDWSRDLSLRAERGSRGLFAERIQIKHPLGGYLNCSY
jgi:hypothetical protein